MSMLIVLISSTAFSLHILSIILWNFWQQYHKDLFCRVIGNMKAQIITLQLIRGANICVRISFKILYDQADFTV